MSKALDPYFYRDITFTTSVEEALNRIETAAAECEDAFVNLNLVIAMEGEIAKIRQELTTPQGEKGE